jgi:hypothetical protein
MTSTLLYPDEILWDHDDVGYPRAHDATLDRLGSAIFASLPRSDQRRKGTEYIHGLLGAEGRKSIRNIAALLGGQATEQSLHHFVCSSTWDWRPVRRALAQYVTRQSPPRAWVVRPMVIPKAGENSVGVDRRFFPALGQVLNGQEAVGIWGAWDDHSVPINWRLHLSRAWLDDPSRRDRAAIPESVVTESLGECAVAAYLSMVTGWGLPVRPVVLDARGTDAVATVARFRAAGIPALVRISGNCPLSVAGYTLPGRGTEVSAERIIGAAGNVGYTAFWRDHRPEARMHASTVTTVRVRIPSAPAEGAQSGLCDDLLLVGIKQSGKRWPSELWLTSMVDARPAELLVLSRLTQRVDRDFDEISDVVGIRDFTGRSFDGWHRHVTLASAAHAVAVETGGTHRHTHESPTGIQHDAGGPPPVRMGYDRPPGHGMSFPRSRESADVRPARHPY